MWEEGFSHLKQFSEQEGHCRVVQGYKTDDGFGLGIWVNKQRWKKDTIEPDRRQRFEALPGWTWDPHSDQWEKGFLHLKQFFDREKHCRVPNDFTTDDGYRLGQWTSAQRNRKTKDSMDLDRRQRLEALPGWSWDVLLDQWEEGYSHLKEVSEREGHCRVPVGYKTDDGYRLGQWTKVQRNRKTKDSMDLDRRQRLEALPGWSWDVLLDQWEEGYSHLKEFSERARHCRVVISHKTNDGYRLGQWVSVQRTRKEKIDLGRRQRLEALPGWSWDVWSDQWEEGFSHLKEFSEREKHCRVPQGYKTDDGCRLGQWVGHQRSTKDKMDPDRRQRLETLPCWVWKVGK
jgi:hypothetical protein